MTEGRRVRFWHPRLDAERDRLMRWSADKEGFVLLGRRRRIGHNSWLHGGTREGTPESAAWMAPADLTRLGIDDGGEVTLKTSEGELRLTVHAKSGIVAGTVVVPHGELAVNINEILPAGADHIEPLSGNLFMTGIPVEVRAEARVPAEAVSV